MENNEREAQTCLHWSWVFVFEELGVGDLGVGIHDDHEHARCHAVRGALACHAVRGQKTLSLSLSL